jgi:uncharacterized protein
MPRRSPNSEHSSSLPGARVVVGPPADVLMRPLILLLDAYRALVAPFLPRSCRFVPSCSTFAREAIETHGSVRGLGLTLHRLVRCQPWNAGGYDPVPPRGL